MNYFPELRFSKPVFFTISMLVCGIFGLQDAALGRDRPGAALKRNIVEFGRRYAKGAIVIDNSERRLYYALGGGKAIQYPIAVGTLENQWTGTSFVQHKQKNPSWTPPWNRSRRVPGGPDNPLGIRAIYLGWSLYRIHGTNNPSSVGDAASRGCFRMFNQDVADLYKRVHIGAPVYVVQ